jgi:hypothetical protein
VNGPCVPAYLKKGFRCSVFMDATGRGVQGDGCSVFTYPHVLHGVCEHHHLNSLFGCSMKVSIERLNTASICGGQLAFVGMV